MTPKMKVEFREMFDLWRPTEGMIGAKAHALATMIDKRRDQLVKLIDRFDNSSPYHLEMDHRIVILNAEISILQVCR